MNVWEQVGITLGSRNVYANLSYPANFKYSEKIQGMFYTTIKMPQQTAFW